MGTKTMPPPPAQTNAQPMVPDGDDGRLATILDVIERLSFTRDLAGVMAVVRASARRLTGADGVTFVLREGDLCHYAEEDAISPLWKGQRFPMERCISGWAMMTGQPAIIEDIYADPRIPHDAYRLTFVRSLVMMPVGAPDPVAAIGAYWARRRMPTEEEVAVLHALARSTGLALSNVRLYQSLADAVRRANSAAEDAKAQAVDLSQANATRTRFLAAASHDLRQPVQALVLSTAALAGHVAPDGQLHFANIERGLGVLRTLLDGVLDLSKLDAGQVRPQIEDIPLADLLAHAEAAFRSAAEAKGLRWRVETGEGAPAVQTDRVLISRILHNLIDNALKYTDSGEIRIACRERGNTLTIDVADTGRGIPPAALGEIFKEFFQVHDLGRDHGLGLGLSIVKALADLLGHRVTVASEVGAGTTFSVELPLTWNRPPPAFASAASFEAAGLLAVLIEDDEMVRTSLEAVFRQWGFDIVGAGSGEEALERLRADGRVPDLVLSDYWLGSECLGIQAIEAIEALVGRRVPGIVLTGDTDPGCDLDAAARGYEVVRKPVMPQRLHAVVARHLAR